MYGLTAAELVYIRKSTLYIYIHSRQPMNLVEGWGLQTLHSDGRHDGQGSTLRAVARLWRVKNVNASEIKNPLASWRMLILARSC